MAVTCNAIDRVEYNKKVTRYYWLSILLNIISNQVEVIKKYRKHYTCQCMYSEI